MAINRIAERAAAYGIPHEMVDGNDMLAVYDVARAARRRRARRRRRVADRRRHDADAGARAARRRAVRAQGDARRLGGEGPAAAIQARAPRARSGRSRSGGGRDRRGWQRASPPPRPTWPSTSLHADPSSVARGVYAGDDYAVPTSRAASSRRSPSDRRQPKADAAWHVRHLPRGHPPGALRRDGADERVFVLGEDVGLYGGAFKVTDGLHRQVRRDARHRHADLRVGDRRLGDRRVATWGCGRSSRCSSSTSSPAASTC